MCIIGLTSRIDVVELLEKRVKSRFSHNFIMLKPLTKSSELLERLKCLLTIDEHSKVQSDVWKNWNNNVELLVTDLQTQNITEDLLKLSNNSSKLNMFIVSNLY